MPWEIESDVVIHALRVHRFMLVNHRSLDLDGEPQRWQYDIVLGVGTDGESCPHCNQQLARGVTLAADGKHVDDDGSEWMPREMAEAKVAQLNELHSRIDNYARRHKAAVFNGAKR